MFAIVTHIFPGPTMSTYKVSMSLVQKEEYVTAAIAGAKVFVFSKSY